MNTIQLSIIVPVFRVEKYLDTCMDSLLNQGFSPQEYEIILVDDGSDDNCPAMCDQYAATHLNIRTIHQTNKGVAYARNIGIKEAKGKYTAFIDSDDTVEIDKLLSLTRELQSTPIDVACFGYCVYSSTGTLLHKEVARGVSHTSMTGLDFLKQQKDFKGYLWRYLFNTQYIKQFSFKEDLRWSEDDEWIQRVLINANSLRVFDEYVYNYHLREDSLTHRYHANVRAIIDTKFQLINYYLQTVTPSTKEWYNFAIGVVVESILTIVGKYNYANHKEIINRIISLQTHPYTIKYCTFLSAIKFSIINISPNLYCLIRHCK